MTRVFCGGERFQTTEGRFTSTAEGMIPHRMHPDGFLMPCKIASVKDDQGRWIRRPARRSDGSVIYMIPGGKEFIE
jgi:hypothetical protein